MLTASPPVFVFLLVTILGNNLLEAAEAPPEFCALSAETGYCRAYLVRYFYDVTQQKCAEFVYGGCGGNDNNFMTKENCTAICTPKPGGPLFTTRKTPLQTTVPGLASFCYLPQDEGDCSGTGKISSNYIRYSYNALNAQCQIFTWNGCRGNGNRFDTLRACQIACKVDASVADKSGGGSSATTPKNSGFSALLGGNVANAVLAAAILVAMAHIL